MRAVKILGPAALCVAVSGCASEPRVEYLQPDCPVIQRPALPELSRGRLWDALGDAEYRRLEAYVNGVWSIVDQQAAALEVVCAPVG